jgi:hypothetical protein
LHQALGLKVSDELPLCRVLHRELHGNELKWWENMKIDAMAAATRLWDKRATDSVGHHSYCPASLFRKKNLGSFCQNGQCSTSSASPAMHRKQMRHWSLILMLIWPVRFPFNNSRRFPGGLRRSSSVAAASLCQQLAENALRLLPTSAMLPISP